MQCRLAVNNLDLKYQLMGFLQGLRGLFLPHLPSFDGVHAALRRSVWSSATCISPGLGEQRA